MELGALVTLTLGGLAELLEVLGGLRDDAVVEVEVDLAGLGWLREGMLASANKLSDQSLKV